MTLARVALLVAAFAAVQSAAPPPIHVDGRFFTAGGTTLRPLFTSGLALLSRSEPERGAFLDEARALGFNGVRVFAGALAWAKQTPDAARARLTSLLDQAARRGLYVEVTAVTDSSTGYDVASHLRQVSAICSAAPNCILEAANEYYHPTQSALVRDPTRLAALARRTIAGPVWALGAPPFDALRNNAWPIPAGDFITVHLDRGRPFWEQLAHVRALARIGARTGKPVINNEPIGAAEVPEPGRRESDPRFYFALGALSRLFELGVVFHSEDGLNGRPLGPRQRRAAEALVAGFTSIPTDARLAITERDDSTLVRGASHTFVATDGEGGWSVRLNVTSSAAGRRGGGWTSVTVIAERPGVEVLKLRR